MELKIELEKSLKKLPRWVWIGTGTIAVYSIYRNYALNYWSRRGVKSPPGQGPLIHAHLFNDSTMAELAKRQFDELDTNMMGLYVGTGWRILLLQDPQLIKEVTIKNFSKFACRFDPSDPLYGVHGPIARDFMTIVDGHRWRRLRHSTTPIMTQSKLSTMLKLINAAAVTMIDNETHIGEDIEVNGWCGDFTIRAILAAVFSIDPTRRDQMEKAKEVVLDLIPHENIVASLLLAIIPERIRYLFGISLYSQSSIKYVQNWIDAALERQKEGHVSGDFMSQMLKLSIEESDKYNANVNKGFTRSEVLATSIISVAAGFETTKSTLEFVVAVIARHQDVQQRLYEHIEQMSDITYEALRDFTYLDAVIKESMRLYSPVPINGRVCNESCTLSNGLTIDPGVSILWYSSWIQEDESHFERANQFDPDRWCDGRERIGQENLDDDKWGAFGEGPRSCPGQRLAMVMMKSLLVHLLRRYKVTESTKSAKVLKINFQNQVHFLKTSANEPILINVSPRQ